MKKKLTQERLKEILYYDPDTGSLTWRANRRRVKKGDIAGCISPDEYNMVRVDGVLYRSHRLIWLYMYGYFPENDIDHIDRKKTNNRIKNLREVSRQCNMRNRNIQKNNKSGITGVYFDNKSNKWRSHIRVNKKLYNLGFYTNLSDAVKYRWKAEVEYNFPNCNTTSSAYKYLKDNGCLK